MSLDLPFVLVDVVGEEARCRRFPGGWVGDTYGDMSKSTVSTSVMCTDGNADAFLTADLLSWVFATVNLCLVGST